MISQLRLRNPSEGITILKSSNDLVIAGYASVELVDKQGDLITRSALNDAFKKYMEKPEFRNVQLAHSNIQIGSVIPAYTDSNGRLWKSEVDDTGMFVVVELRNDIEKAREVAAEVRKGNLQGFSIGGQAFKRVRKSDREHGDYQEISKLELHEITICEKGINPEAQFRILKGENMTEDVEQQLKSVLNRLESRMDNLDKGLPPAFLEDNDNDKESDSKNEGDEVKDEKKDEKKDEEDDMEKSEYSDVISSEYLNWMENTLKSAGVDTGAARQHFDDVNKAQLGGFDNPDSVDGADYFGGQVRGRGQDSGSPSTGAVNALTSGGGKTPSGALGPLKKEYVLPENVSDAEIEAAYGIYKAAAQEQAFRNDLEKQFSARFNQETQQEVAQSELAGFDPRGPLGEIQKAIASLSERIDNISTESVTIAKAENNEFDVPSTQDLASMSWDEVHRLAGSAFRGA